MVENSEHILGVLHLFSEAALAKRSYKDTFLFYSFLKEESYQLICGQGNINEGHRPWLSNFLEGTEFCCCCSGCGVGGFAVAYSGGSFAAVFAAVYTISVNYILATTGERCGGDFAAAEFLCVVARFLSSYRILSLLAAAGIGVVDVVAAATTITLRLIVF
ncbi:Hypothetical predicted protein [Octopus vulgaris]|uniref:Uncharacterized protein n=1 Tax=Octopus vulgaris TaxID=6645 RepID=A0AA36F7H5_OCTVU|nr:Hypothetical predicted protein [Octopus vulgaris]